MDTKKKEPIGDLVASLFTEKKYLLDGDERFVLSIDKKADLVKWELRYSHDKSFTINEDDQLERIQDKIQNSSSFSVIQKPYELISIHIDGISIYTTYENFRKNIGKYKTYLGAWFSVCFSKKQ
jgi:hypothetical protein